MIIRETLFWIVVRIASHNASYWSMRIEQFPSLLFLAIMVFGRLSLVVYPMEPTSATSPGSIHINFYPTFRRGSPIKLQLIFLLGHYLATSCSYQWPCKKGFYLICFGLNVFCSFKKLKFVTTNHMKLLRSLGSHICRDLIVFHCITCIDIQLEEMGKSSQCGGC